MKKILIALTGPMGGGKSLASSIFYRLGANVISTDILAKRVLIEDAQARSAARKLLGEACFDSDGYPISKEISKVVFSDRTKLEAFEAIIHPLTRLAWQNLAEKFGGINIVEIPLLFEKKLEKHFDICATLYCSERIRLQRLAARGLNSAEIAARDAFQMSAQKKVDLADIVFFNDGSPSFLEDQIKIFVNRIYGRRD